MSFLIVDARGDLLFYFTHHLRTPLAPGRPFYDQIDRLAVLARPTRPIVDSLVETVTSLNSKLFSAKMPADGGAAPAQELLAQLGVAPGRLIKGAYIDPPNA
jgi:hypothetical protein